MYIVLKIDSSYTLYIAIVYRSCKGCPGKELLDKMPQCKLCNKDAAKVLQGCNISVTGV